MVATVDLAIPRHSLDHPRIQIGRLRNQPLLTVLLGLERLTMKRTTPISVLQLRHLFAKPMHRKLGHRRLWRVLSLRRLASHTHRHHILHQPAPVTNALPNYDVQALDNDVILTFSQTIPEA